MTETREVAGWEEEHEVVASEWLLARSKQGDLEAVGELFRRWGPRIHRAVRRHLSKDSPLRRLLDSTDVAQSVSLHLLGLLERGQVTAATVSQFKELVERIVQHHITQTWRTLTSKRRDLRRTVSLDAMKRATVEDAQESWQIADGHDQIECLVRLMSAEEYELVRLRLLGFGWEELAARYQTTAAALRGRHLRIRKRIRSQFAGGGGGQTFSRLHG